QLPPRARLRGVVAPRAEDAPRGRTAGPSRYAMSARWMGSVLALSLLAVPAAAVGQQGAAGHAPGGLGVGRGVDHVASLVRLPNFDAAVSVLTDQLGFSATAVLLSPLGAKNRLIWFDDLSYLEVDAFTEAN